MKEYVKFVCLSTVLMFVTLSLVSMASAEMSKEGIAIQEMSPQVLLSNVEVSNDYIKVIVAPEGTYTMWTTGGDPGTTADDDARLLFGASPWSSYLTVKIDDVNYVTKDEGMNTYWVSGPTVVGDSIVTEWLIDDITVKQTIQVITSSTTNRPDTALFKISFANQGTVSHTVGARFMFDTMISSNDAAPFRIPGTGDVTTEHEYFSNNMPDFWQAFDTLTSPSLIAQGTLSTSTVPDRFVLANWGSLYDASWDYSIDSGSYTGDSATAMYWNPISLASGYIVEYTTAYGLGGITATPGEFSIAVSAPYTLSSATDNFTVMAYVSNTGGSTVNDVVAHISLPSGLNLGSGYSTSIPVGNLGTGTSEMVSWEVQATGIPGNYTYELTASSSNVASITVSRYVIVPETIMVCIGGHTGSIGGTTTVPVGLSNGDNIAGGVFDVNYDSTVVSVQGVTIGDVGSTLAYNIISPGLVRISTSGPVAVGTSDATLANIVFYGEAAGTSALSLQTVTLNDASGNLVTPSTSDGEISVGSTGCPLNGDLNGNGFLDTGDATMLLRIIVGLD